MSTTVEQRLSSVRRKWLLRDVLLSLSCVVLVLGILCPVLGWLDWRLNFSPTWRAASLAAILASLALVIFRIVRPRLIRPRDLEATAIQVESAFARFGGRLVSRVEFAGGAIPAGTSTELVHAMCRQVDTSAAQTPMEKCIDMRPLRYPGLAALAILVCATLLMFTQPALTAIWIERTLAPWREAPWPRRTQIEGLEMFYRIQRGNTLTLTGQLAGEIPSYGRLRWSTVTAGTSKEGSLAFDVREDGAFQAGVGPLLDDVILAVDAGDATFGDIRVEVVVPPEMREIRARYDYPDFTSRADDTVESGDIRAIVGTEVTLTLTADKPAQRMELVFMHAEGRETRPVEHLAPTRGEASFTVSRRSRYEVRLYDEYGFTSDSPATFVVDPIENELPTVEILRPGMEHQVTPSTRLTMSLEAQDDYGVAAALIHWRKVGASDAAGNDRSGHQAIPILRPQKVWRVDYPWDLAGLTLVPGDEIEYQIEIRDQGEHLSETKSTITRPRRLVVVDSDSLKQILDRRGREALSDFDQLQRQQRSSRDEVQILILRLAETEASVLPEDRQRLHLETNRQRRIQRQVQRLADRLDALALELHDSFLAEPQAIARIRDMADGLRELDRDKIGRVLAQLEDARERFDRVQEPSEDQP